MNKMTILIALLTGAVFAQAQQKSKDLHSVYFERLQMQDSRQKEKIYKKVLAESKLIGQVVQAEGNSRGNTDHLLILNSRGDVCSVNIDSFMGSDIGVSIHCLDANANSAHERLTIPGDQ